MTKQFPLFAALMIAGMCTFTRAETRVGGALHGDNRWDLEGSPYVVQSDLVITRFAHLTIDPGVRVVIARGSDSGETVPQFDAPDSGSVSIKVEGALNCVGKRNKRITFVPAEASDGKLGWYGIIFNKANGKFCEIAFADITGAFNGVTVYECRPLVRNSVIEYNNIGVSCQKNGGALIYNCIISNNYAAGIRVQEANPHVANCIVMRNRNNGLWCDGISKVQFEFNCVWGNSDGNFLDCDPLLGKIVRLNKNRDSVDNAGNLRRDPVFFGTPAESVAFARDTRLPTDKSKVKNVDLAKVVNTRLRDSGFARYKSQKRPRYFLSRYSPCINAGSPAGAFKDADGSRNDIGIFGGPDFIARGKE
jgi:hypothetical protein